MPYKDPANQKIASRRHYDANKQKCKTRSIRHRAGHKALIHKLKSQPCHDCGVSYPYYVMHFDHTRGVKLREISRMTCMNIQRVMDEIAKCDLVCSNCHAERSHKRGYPRANRVVSDSRGVDPPPCDV